MSVPTASKPLPALSRATALTAAAWGTAYFWTRLAMDWTGPRLALGIAVTIGYGLVGPNLRASGVDWDLRRDTPYSVYPELDFQVVVGQGWRGVVGDAYDRFYCRILEMRESLSLVRQACARLPEGEYWAQQKKLKPAANEVYVAIENARGEVGAYVVSDGTDKPYRTRFRTGSFTGISIIEHLSPGILVADLVALIGSLDVIAPEVDR